MTRPRSSVDGFIPRRPGAPIRQSQELGGKRTSGHPSAPTVKTAPTGKLTTAEMNTLRRTQVAGLTRPDIAESLRELDDTPPPPKKQRRWRLARPRSVRRVIKWLVILMLLVGLVVGGWLGFKALSNVNGVFKGGILGLTQKKPLKQDANGRSNVLIFGTSEDSADHADAGSLLTDSMMVLSVNQEKKDAFMVSIPRDLWIKFDEPCSVGWQEKINSVYQCGSDFGENPEAGAAALQKKVGEVLGLDIQYYGQIDYSVVTRAVDAVGGVDITIESNPPGVGILDRNFDWKCNYQCYYVKYKDGETVHLDGERAMMLSRARNAQGGYGLAGGNFDREKNQQKILKAVREKALSVGTLTNVGRVTDLIEAMGDNLKTNVDTTEIQTIMSLSGDIQSGAITSLDLYDTEKPIMTTGPVGAASAVYPVAGLFDYSQLRAFIARASTMDAATKEGATVDVLNGSGVMGAAQKEGKWLESKGFTIGEVRNAPASDYITTKIYQRTTSMSATKAKLESLYNVKATTELPESFGGDADFIVIIGEGSLPRSQEP